MYTYVQMNPTHHKLTLKIQTIHQFSLILVTLFFSPKFLHKRCFLFPLTPQNLPSAVETGLNQIFWGLKETVFLTFQNFY